MSLKITFHLLLTTLFLSNQTLACSSFSFGSNSDQYFGKSYDWGYGHGMVAINKKNIKKTSVVLNQQDNPWDWTSKYASATFTQFGREFPLGGINEAGFVVEIMWLNQSEYPTYADSTLPVVNELQWIQYILDTSSTIQDAILNAKKVRVTSVFANVHYLACDNTGACATFEYLNKKLVIGEPNKIIAKALTNNTQTDSEFFLKKHKGFGGNKEVEFTSSSSLDRYAILATQIKNFSPSKHKPIEYGFDTLTAVRAGTYTKWHIVYDQKNLSVSFRSSKQLTIKNFNLKSFDYSCLTPAQVIDMNDKNLSGNINSKFTDSNFVFNKAMLDNNPFIDEDLRALAANYPEQNTTCLSN